MDELFICEREGCNRWAVPGHWAHGHLCSIHEPGPADRPLIDSRWRCEECGGPWTVMADQCPRCGNRTRVHRGRTLDACPVCARTEDPDVHAEHFGHAPQAP